MDSQPPQLKDPLSAPELPKVPAGAQLPPRTTSWGSVIAIIIIILLLIVGALYFWGAKLSEENKSLPNTETPAPESGTGQSAPLQ